MPIKNIDLDGLEPNSFGNPLYHMADGFAQMEGAFFDLFSFDFNLFDSETTTITGKGNGLVATNSYNKTNTLTASSVNGQYFRSHGTAGIPFTLKLTTTTSSQIDLKAETIVPNGTVSGTVSQKYTYDYTKGTSTTTTSATIKAKTSEGKFVSGTYSTSSSSDGSTTNTLSANVGQSVDYLNGEFGASTDIGLSAAYISQKSGASSVKFKGSASGSVTFQTSTNTTQTLGASGSISINVPLTK